MNSEISLTLQWLIKPIWILFYYLRVRHFRKFKSRSSLEAWQEKKVIHFFKKIILKSPYLKKQFESRSLEQWRELPVMDKKVMMEHFSELNTAGLDRDEALRVALMAEESRDFSPTLKGVTVGLSSGTSGNRGLFLASPSEQWSYAGTILAKILPRSILSGHKVAFFMRANSNLYEASKSSRIRFEFFDMMIPVVDQVDRLNRFSPTLLIAPPPVLRILANLKHQGDLKIQPEKTVSVAEVLEPKDENNIAKAFGAPVHQVYQCTEGFLGLTCKYGVIHLNEDLVHIEKQYLDSDRKRFVPVVTDFTRTTQPIVRYRLNDVLVERSEKCLCGSVFTALDRIEGRCDDVFYLKSTQSGGWIPIFPDFIRRSVIVVSDQIEEYQIRQTGSDQIEVRLDLSSNSSEHPDLIRHRIYGRIHQELDLLFEKQGVIRPKIQFMGRVEKDGIKKMRRIQRMFAIEGVD